MNLPLHWKCAGASVAGSAHERDGLPNQDAFFYEEVEAGEESHYMLLVVADGAGSARHADIGSRQACQQISEAIIRALRLGQSADDFNDGFFKEWIAGYHKVIDDLAGQMDCTRRSFASTLILCLAGARKTLFFQIGDGAMVYDDPSTGRYELGFWPQTGEYANATHFITDDDAVSSFMLRTIEDDISQIAAFSDGLQGVCLQYQEKEAFQPFFQEMFSKAALFTVEDYPRLESGLADFLSSPALASRTDDDKTLLLAVRRTGNA